ncbi:MAG TPA: single-stranded-DNA-specific exonuclease RecJ, partial [Ruminococcaceae bacterium]|nr:single-stranded-DNA-specific exonuclease RecJ [Oscillospiraceae bacterium]
MGMKKWQTAEIDRALAKELAEECDIDPIIALIAVERGYTDPAALEEFISDEPCFDDPTLLADIEKAADIINNAVNGKIKTAVYGDYDCDGVTATALLYSYLQSRGANCIYYIPDRISEGYGMNTAAVDRLAKEGVKLIVTVDNGIAAADEILYAKTLGIDVVVTDHHLPQGELPPAAAVVDPHRADCPSEFKEVCGAQVAFKLVCVMEGK